MADGKYVYPPVRRKRCKRSPIGPILIIVLILAVITVWGSVLLRSCGPDLEAAPTDPVQTEPATEAPVEEPTEEVTEAPTEEPTEEVTEEPTEEPTEEATEEPTEEPTEEATEEPTEEPTEEATEAPTLSPSEQKARGQQMAEVALAQVGKPYAFGGIGPNAFDTSGLLTYCYKQVTGETLSEYTSVQAQTGTAVDKEDLQPGDVVFFWTSNPDAVEYQGIYIGDGKFVAARNPENPVSEMNLGSEYFTERYLFARRYW